MYRSAFFLLAGLLLLIGLTGCASTVYKTAVDKRPVGIIKDDLRLRYKVGDALKDQGFTGVNELTVYSYFGRVFLTGEVPTTQHAKVVQIAQSVQGVTSVTAHWFTSLPADTAGDVAVKVRLEKNLVTDGSVIASRIDYVVNSGRVVLLGVVASDAEHAAAVQTARHTDGVRSVTSYLFTRDMAPAPL